MQWRIPNHNIYLFKQTMFQSFAVKILNWTSEEVKSAADDGLVVKIITEDRWEKV